MFNDYIIKLRKEAQLSQDFVATKLELSRPTYAQIERGERDITLSELKILADIFNVSVEDFINQKITDYSIQITNKNSTPSKQEIRINIPQQKLHKFEQVLLYILRQVGGKPNIGMTTIYKLLYFIDFDYYEKYEEQLMGLQYIKNHYGPTPIIFEKVIKDLISTNQVEVIKSKFYQHEQKKYLINPNIPINLNLLNGNEISHIDWELQRLADLNAKTLSDLSHKDVPWVSAVQGKQIDYESVFYRTSETSVREYLDENS